MEVNDQHSNNLSFTKKGAWLGFVAYMILIAVIAMIFLLK